MWRLSKPHRGHNVAVTIIYNDPNDPRKQLIAMNAALWALLRTITNGDNRALALQQHASAYLETQTKHAESYIASVNASLSNALPAGATWNADKTILTIPGIGSLTLQTETETVTTPDSTALIPDPTNEFVCTLPVEVPETPSDDNETIPDIQILTTRIEPISIAAYGDKVVATGGTYAFVYTLDGTLVRTFTVPNKSTVAADKDNIYIGVNTTGGYDVYSWEGAKRQSYSGPSVVRKKVTDTGYEYVDPDSPCVKLGVLNGIVFGSNGDVPWYHIDIAGQGRKFISMPFQYLYPSGTDTVYNMTQRFIPISKYPNEAPPRWNAGTGITAFVPVISNNYANSTIMNPDHYPTIGSLLVTNNGKVYRLFLPSPFKRDADARPDSVEEQGKWVYCGENKGVGPIYGTYPGYQYVSVICSCGLGGNFYTDGTTFGHNDFKLENNKWYHWHDPQKIEGGYYYLDYPSSQGVLYEAAGNLEGIAHTTLQGGKIYYADISQCCLRMPDMTAFGSRGTDPGKFISPRGVAVDQFGEVYVADTGNMRIQKIHPVGAGSMIKTWNVEVAR